MKRVQWTVAFIAILATFIYGAEPIRRNISWTFESGNDPILQITNESDNPRILTIRILFDQNSYRWRGDYEVPSGENRFIRIKDVLEQLTQKYSEVKQYSSGVVQVEYEGSQKEIITRVVNLSPKSGVTSEKEQEMISAPVLNSIEPDNGGPAGGTSVRIVGENFTESTSVKFGGVPAMRNLQSKEVLIAVAPAHSPAVVDVEVSNGKKTARLTKAFRYEAEGPTITQLDPETGPARGGMRVNIAGRNFQKGTVVKWEGKELTSRFQSAELLNVVVPPGHAGTVQIEVVNPDGKNFVLPDAFEYRGAPQANGVNPSMGSPRGGYTVTVTGNNFEPGASVLFGGRYGQTTFINANALAAIVPQNDSGFVDIVVSNPDGEASSLSEGFLYNDPPVIRSVIATPNPIVRMTQSHIVVDAADPEIGDLLYEFRVAQGPQGGYVTSQGNEAIYNSPNNVGLAIIQVIVTDEHGAQDQSTVEIRVQ